MNGVANLKGFIQSVKTSPWHLSLRVRYEGCTSYLLIPRGGALPTALISENELPSEFRCNDKLREKLKSTISNSFLSDVLVMDNYLILNIKKKNIDKKILFFYGDSRLYFGIFADGESYILYRKKQVFRGFSSPKQELVVNEIKNLEEHVVKKNLLTIKNIKNYDDEVQIESKKKKSISFFHKKKKRKLIAIESDLLKLRDAISLKEDLILGKIVFNDDTKYLKYKHIYIKLSRIKSVFKKRDYVFKKCKAYERAIIIQEKRLTNLKKQIAINTFDWSGPIVLAVKSVLPAIGSMASKNNIGHLIEGANGEIFKFGRDVAENITIRKMWSKKTDYWFHVENASSAHCFLRLKNIDDKVTNYHLEVVGKYFCQVNKCDSIDLIYGKVKYLKALPGHAGTVYLTKPRYYKYILKN